MTSTGPYVQALLDSLPSEYANQLNSELLGSISAILDIALSFSAGGPYPPDASLEIREQWATSQTTFRHLVNELNTNPTTKRAREDEDSINDLPDAKKPRSESEDPPLFTLHSISVTSPVRKKVNITIHQSTLRFTHPTSHVLESKIPISSLKRGFLLPTRGKNKPHWTVIVSSVDIPPITGGKGSSSNNTKEDQPQVVFGVDAMPPNITITDHTSGSSDPTAHPKGTPSLPHLQAFLSHLPFQVMEPSATIFKSALSASNAQGGGVAGVDGFRGAKPGTLWFFGDGVLWDGKPSEFWDLSDLVGGSRKGKEKAIDVDLGGADGVRTISATGRTCSVILRRKVAVQRKDQSGEGTDSEEDAEEDNVVDTDIGMVDGKEQEAISRWVKKYRHLFGQAPILRENGASDRPNPNEDNDSDEDDSDFVTESESDGGSATSSSDESDGEANDGGSADVGEVDSEDLSSLESEDGMEVDDFDPKHHPLMRPGAMPRMSKAAMDTVVGMVQEVFMGPSGGGQESDVEDEDEEDELED